MGQPFKNHLTRSTLIAIGLATCGVTAQADDLKWSGFFSTGVVFSDQKIPYKGDITKKPDVGGETVLGLNLAKAISPRLQVAAQFLAQEQNADSALKADWAFVTYNPINSLEVTVGKQKLPMWIVSSYLDVGAVYPWARPPEEVYALFEMKAFTGASLRQSVDIGPTSLAVQAYGGETVIEVTPSAPTDGSKVEADNMFGSTIEWTWNQTVARVAYNRAMWDLSVGALDLGRRRFEVMSYGLSTKWSDLSLMAEYATTKDLDEQKYQDLSEEKAEEAAAAAAAGDTAGATARFTESLVYSFKLGGSKAYYVTTGYQFSHAALYLTYANLKKTPIEGATEDQNSTALGINIEPDESSVIKVEAKRISVPDESRGMFKDPDMEQRKDLDGTMIYSVNYNLIF